MMFVTFVCRVFLPRRTKPDAIHLPRSAVTWTRTRACRSNQWVWMSNLPLQYPTNPSRSDRTLRTGLLALKRTEQEDATNVTITGIANRTERRYSYYQKLPDTEKKQVPKKTRCLFRKDDVLFLTVCQHAPSQPSPTHTRTPVAHFTLKSILHCANVCMMPVMISEVHVVLLAWDGPCGPVWKSCRHNLQRFGQQSLKD